MAANMIVMAALKARVATMSMTTLVPPLTRRDGLAAISALAATGRRAPQRLIDLTVPPDNLSLGAVA